MTEYVKTTDNFNTWREKTNSIHDSVGDLSLLDTTNKTSIVGSINEIKQILSDLNLQISDLDLTETLQLVNSILDGISGGDASGYPTDTFNTKLQVRRAFEYEWLEANPVLSDGELSINKSNGKIKIGNGTSNWADLPYFDTLHNHDTRYVTKDTSNSGNIDFNTFVVPGQYQFSGISGIVFSHQPPDFSRGTMIVTNGSDSFYVQQLILSQDNNMYYRVSVNNTGIRTWGIWRNVSNYDDLYSNINHIHSSYESDISALESTTTTHTNDISSINSGLVSIQSDITAINNDISALESITTTHTSDISSINSGLTSIQSDITTINNDIISVQSDVTTLQTEMSNAKSDITVINGDINDITNSLDDKYDVHTLTGVSFNFNDNTTVNGIYRFDNTNTYSNHPTGFTDGIMVLSDNGSILYKQQLLLGNNTIYYRNSYDSSGLTWNDWNVLSVNSTQIIQQTSSGNIASSSYDSMVIANSSSDITITPTAGDFPIGFKINITRYGTGEVIFLSDTGETILSQSGYLKINSQYDVVVLYKISSTEWILTGNLKS